MEYKIANVKTGFLDTLLCNECGSPLAIGPMHEDKLQFCDVCKDNHHWEIVEEDRFSITYKNSLTDKVVREPR